MQKQSGGDARVNFEPADVSQGSYSLFSYPVLGVLHTLQTAAAGLGGKGGGPRLFGGGGGCQLSPGHRGRRLWGGRSRPRPSATSPGPPGESNGRGLTVSIRLRPDTEHLRHGSCVRMRATRETDTGREFSSSGFSFEVCFVCLHCICLLRIRIRFQQYMSSMFSMGVDTSGCGMVPARVAVLASFPTHMLSSGSSSAHLPASPQFLLPASRGLTSQCWQPLKYEHSVLHKPDWKPAPGLGSNQHN